MVDDHRPDRGLGLAVGERPGRGVRLTDETGIGMDADEEVLGHCDLAAGEAERLPVRDGVGDRLDLRDLHVSSITPAPTLVKYSIASN